MIGVVSRLAGARFLELKWDKEAKSYWNYRGKEKASRSAYEKQF